MAGNIFDMINRMPQQPQQPGVAARMQGLLATPGQQAQPRPTGFQGGVPLSQLYGMLAQHADDPTRIGMDYVGAVQAQQQLDQQNNPVEKFLRLYGNVNPYDFTPQSLQEFHNNFVQTGQLQFDLLEDKAELSSTEQGILNTAIEGAYQAESDLGRMTDLAQRYEQLVLSNPREGIAGRAEEWFKNLLGGEDELSQLRTEYYNLSVKSIVNNLPPGVASDKDIELVMRGWPAPTADSAYIASFLRGMMKLRAIEAAHAQHTAAYLSTHRSQEGQLNDWNIRREAMIRQAIEPFGGVYNPVDPETGLPMDAERAAGFYFDNRSFGGPASGSPAQPGSQDLSEYSTDDLVEFALKPDNL